VKADTSTENSKSSAISYVGISLGLALFIYCNYIGVLFIAGAGLATLYLKWKYKSFPLIKYLIAFAAAVALFLPWMPVLINQVKVPAVWEEKTPLIMFPVVFLSNLSCVVPLPFMFVALVTALGALWICIWFIRQAWKKEAVKGASECLSCLSAVDAALLIILIVPCSLLGYITSYYFGFYRYMYPFLPVGWTLLSVLSVFLLNGAADYLKATRPKWQKAPAVFAASLLIFSNLQQAFSLGHTPRSGLKTLAKDVAAGKYRDTAFLVVPDFDGITFAYYLDHHKVPAGDVAFHGFARWDADGPWHSADYGALWRDPQLVGAAENRLKELADSGKYRYLAFVRDPYNPNTPLMPSRQRINELFNRLTDHYQMVRQTKYEGITEPVDIYFFDLSANPRPETDLQKD